MFWTLAAAFLLSTFSALPAAGNGHDGSEKAARTTLPLSHPIYPVRVRSENSNAFLDGLDSPDFVRGKPWVIRRPEPFYYREDVDKAPAQDTNHVFLVAGVNCTQTLKSVTTISGVDMDTLNQRASWHRYIRSNRPAMDSHFNDFQGFPFARGEEPAPPYWQSINNAHLRASMEGFLHSFVHFSDGGTRYENETLRERLTLDNDIVLGEGLTHQQVADPLLRAIESFEAGVRQGRSKVEFEFRGERYRVMGMEMEGAIVGRRHGKLQPTDNLRSGWIGAGVQGSFFNDELFAGWIFVITDAKGKILMGDALTPHLIHRYGFYQGGPFRIDPNEVIRFFKISPSRNEAVAACQEVDGRKPAAAKNPQSP